MKTVEPVRLPAALLDLEVGFGLGEAVVRPRASSLDIGGESRRIDFKAMQVLLCLARGSGEEVSKRRLFADVWGGDVVSDDVLTGAVSTLRRALGDDARSPRFIQTIPRVGYRLIAPVTPLDATDPGGAEATVGARPSERWLLLVALGAIGALVVLGLMAWGLEWQQRSPEGPDAATAAVRSLAVLPLANFTGDTGREHLADGMTEALIAGLAQAPTLRVISRTSSMRYRNTELDASAIARELGVDALVEGSVQQAGDHLRVTVQLIDAEADRNLWSDSFDAPASEAMALQLRVANAISRRLRGTPERSPPVATFVDPDAYDAFLRGRYHAQDLDDPQAQRLAIAELERAARMAPDFAQAHAALAESWLLLVKLGGILPVEGYGRARTHAERAAELDPSSAFAETLLGALAYIHDWDFVTAEQRLRRGLEIDPSDAVAHGWLARFLTSMRRFEDALAEVQWVRQLDPLAYSRPEVARLLNLMGRHDLALAELDAQLRLEPDALNLHYERLFALKAAGRVDDAVDAFLHTLELQQVAVEQRRRVEAGYRAEGLPGIYRHYLESTPEPAADAPGSAALSYAETLLGAGELERGLDWLELAADRREPGVVEIGTYSAFDVVRDRPRFQALMRRIGLPG